MNIADLERARRIRNKAAESETQRLARRPSEDSVIGYARIQRARAKRARRNARRKREMLTQATLL